MGGDRGVMGNLIVKILIYGGVFYVLYEWLVYLQKFLNSIYPIDNWLFWVVFLVIPLIKAIADKVDDE